MMPVVMIAAIDITAPTERSTPPEITTIVCPAAAKLSRIVCARIEPNVLMLSDRGLRITVISSKPTAITAAMPGRLYLAKCRRCICMLFSRLSDILFPPLELLDKALFERLALRFGGDDRRKQTQEDNCVADQILPVGVDHQAGNGTGEEVK